MICDCLPPPAIEPGLGADAKLSCSTEGSTDSGLSTWGVVASPGLCRLPPRVHRRSSAFVGLA